MFSAKIAELKINLSTVNAQLKGSQIRTDQGVNFAARDKLNEALFYIVEACEHEDEALLTAAHHAILEALYISCESEAYYYLKVFKQFSDRWQPSRIIISEVAQDWRDWSQLFDELSDYIIQTRSDQPIYARVLHAKLDKPRSICSGLGRLEQDLVKKENEYNRTIRYIQLGIVISLAAIVIAAVVAYWIYFLQKSDSEHKNVATSMDMILIKRQLDTEIS
jgi:hypothetical protein